MARRRTDLEPGRVEFPSEDVGGHQDYLVSFIRKLSYFYLKTDRRSQTVVAILPGQIVKWPFNNAYPRAMEPLIDELERLTALIPSDPKTAILGGDVPQWRADRDAWKKRLRHYRDIQNKAMRTEFEGGMPEGPDFSEIPVDWDPLSQQYLDEVALPLLLGWYPGQDVQKPLDAATPISLAYQAQIIDEHIIQSLRQFAIELKNRAIAAAQITVGVGSLALVALGIYGAIEFMKAYRGKA